MKELTQFSKAPKKTVSFKEALKRLRGLWLRGPVDRFDLKLSRVLDCNLDYAAKVRESWEIMGFLSYDRRGLLVWRNRSC